MSGERTETPVVIPVGSEHVFGVLVEPPEPSDIGVLILSAGFSHAGPGKDRLYVRLARRLAADGLASLRIDYVGTGESSGGVRWPAAAHPDAADVEAAARRLRDHGYERLVVVGSCYGVWAGLAFADRLPGLIAVVLLAPPVRVARWGTVGDWTLRKLLRRSLRPAVWRRLLSPERRRTYRHLLGQYAGKRIHTLRVRATQRPRPIPREPDPELVDGLGRLQRQVPILLVWGDADKWPIDTGGGPEALRSVFAPPGSQVELLVLAGCVAGLRGPRMASTLIETVGAWCADFVSRSLEATGP